MVLTNVVGVPTLASLAVIVSVLGLSIGASLLVPTSSASVSSQ